MVEEVVIHTLEDLKKFLEQNNISELVQRDQLKRFKKFYNVVIEELPKKDPQEAIEKLGKVIGESLSNANGKLDKIGKKIGNINLQLNEHSNMLNKALKLMSDNNGIAEKSLKIMQNVAKVQNVCLILNGANLCATCVGFAVMNEKLNKISKDIKETVKLIKNGNEVQIDYEFNKITSEHANMLDSRKTKKYYTEEQMRKLVDDEYNLLVMLVDAYKKNITDNTDNMIILMYSLAGMLSVSLRYFDEEYYFNNRETIGDGEIWHSSHDKWVSVFDSLCEKDIIESIQDYATFDLKLGTMQVDAYYLSLYDQAKEYKEDVEYNQFLIKTLNNKESLENIEKEIKEETANSIKKSFEEAGAFEDEAVAEAYENAMRLVALT